MPAEPENLDAELSAYLDGELPPERAAEVRAHLEGSPDARRLLAELTAVSDGLRALPRTAPPAGLADTVSHEIGQRRRRMQAGRRRKVWWWSSSLSAAALLVLAVLLGREAWPRRPAESGAPVPVVAREMRSAARVAGASASPTESPPLSPTAGAAQETVVVIAERDKAEQGETVTDLARGAESEPLLIQVPADAETKALAGRGRTESAAEFSLVPAGMEQYTALLAMLREWVVAGLAKHEVTPVSDPQIYVLASPHAADQVAKLVQAAASDQTTGAQPRETAATESRARMDTRGRAPVRAPAAAATSTPATGPAAESQPSPGPVRVIIHRPPQKGRED